MQPELAIPVLESGTALLDKLGVKWWLSAGTVLGAYRDGFSDEFIKADSDIDVGIYVEKAEDTIEIAKKIFGLFGMHRFRPIRCYKVEGGWTQLALEHDNKIIFDIYFFREAGEQIIAYTEFGHLVKPKRFIEPTGTLLVRGREYPVPNPVEDYLVVRIGEDWRTPKPKTTQWFVHCPNLVKMDNVKVSWT